MICETFDPGCYGCRLRAKGIDVSPAATPSRRNSRPPRTPDPAWERGRVGEHRPDGSFMPYLAPGTDRAMGVKEFADNRGGYEAQLDRLRSDPNVFKKESVNGNA